MRTVFFTLLMILGASTLGAQANEDIDLLGIAGILLRDGNYAKAQETLDQLDLKNPTTDLIRFYTFSGLLALRLQDFPRAEGFFRDALGTGNPDGSLYAYLAQALFSQEKYQETLEAITLVPRIRTFPDLLGLKSQALWKLDRKNEAIEVLQAAFEDFPSRLSFLQQQIFFLLELNLTQKAMEVGQEYRYRAAKDPQSYLTLGEAFRRGKELDSAVAVLETGRKAFPSHTKIKVSLAQTYLEKGFPRTAAALVEEASLSYAQLILEAAELYRRTKQYNRALYLNGLISDLPQKTKQRFNLLLESEKYESAMALLPRLERQGLMEEDRMKYAAAYVCFQVQSYDRAQEYLSKITSSDVFSQAVALRRALETAKAEPLVLF